MDISEVKSMVADIELEREFCRNDLKQLRYELKKLDKRINYFKSTPPKYARDTGIGQLLIDRAYLIAQIDSIKLQSKNLSTKRRGIARKMWKTK